jgi:chitinase
MGEWASGGWFDVGAIEYITSVRRTALAQPWPEAVKIKQPVNGDTVSGAVEIVTQLAPSVGWENLFVDGQYLASSPPDTFTWNSTGASGGTHTITARAFNSKDQPIGTASITVVTNQSADSLTISAPSSGATVSGKVNIVTKTGAGVAWENIYIDNRYLASSPPYTFGWNSASVADGTHTISARAFAANGEQVNSTAVSVKTANDVAVKIMQPLAGGPVKGVTSIVTEVSGKVAREKIYVDSHHVASSPPYTFSWNSTGVANGIHTIAAKAYDDQGRKIGRGSVKVHVGN